jgi:hypothetical protein
MADPMPRSPRRKGARASSSAESRLARLLDGPQLPAIVPRLAPETVCRLIRHRGLDESASIVALATPEQLTAVLDLDLWRALRPGLDERFDAQRFGEWLEALVEWDGERAASVVATMDPDLVAAGLSGHVRVFDVAALLPPTMDDLESIGDPAPDALEREVGGYALRARRADAWDAIVRLLTILASDHTHAFDAIMRRCRRLSDSPPEIDGLDELLSVPDQLTYDLGGERDDRRKQRGYLAPAEARAFLTMARQSRHAPLPPEGAANPFAADYLRSAEPPGPDPGVDSPAGDAAAALETAEAARVVAELLDEVGTERPRPRARLAGPEGGDSRLSRILSLLEHVRDRDTDAYLTRSREVAFLANALLSGCSLQSRSLTPQEARDAALSVCNLGLERRGDGLRDSFLLEHDLLSPFETGWAALFQEVSRVVSRALLRTLDDLRPADPDTRIGLLQLGRELRRQCEAGTPWRARDALDVLATLDTTVWASLLGLLEECPVIPAAMTAILERHAGAVSPTAFEFISTVSQIDAVREFAAELPERLQLGS